LPGANGGVLPVATSGQGFMWSIVNDPPVVAIATGNLSGSANEVRAFQFVATRTGTYSNVIFDLTATSGGSTGDLCLYNAAGTQIAGTGGFTTASGGITKVALSAPVTITQGQVLIFAQVDTSSTANMMAYTLPVAGEYNMTNLETTKRWGIAANAGTAGVCPGTLGAITASTAVGPVAVMFVP
jgi:hypothetical protein